VHVNVSTARMGTIIILQIINMSSQNSLLTAALTQPWPRPASRCSWPASVPAAIGSDWPAMSADTAQRAQPAIAMSRALSPLLDAEEHAALHDAGGRLQQKAHQRGQPALRHEIGPHAYGQARGPGTGSSRTNVQVPSVGTPSCSPPGCSEPPSTSNRPGSTVLTVTPTPRQKGTVSPGCRCCSSGMMRPALWMSTETLSVHLAYAANCAASSLSRRGSEQASTIVPPRPPAGAPPRRRYRTPTGPGRAATGRNAPAH